MRYEQLLSDLGDALERGDVKPAAVERLLRPRPSSARPDVAGVLRGVGALVMFAGVALLYAIQFSSMGSALQRVSPLVFPLVALAVAVALHRKGRPPWEVELAGVVGYVAFGLAVGTIAAVTDAGVGAGVWAGLAATVVVLVMHRLLGILRLTIWGLSASLVALSGFAAATAGLTGGAVSWLLLAQALTALVIGAVALGRSPEVAAGAWRTASLLGYAACLVGIGAASWSTIGPWHALLTLVVVATFVAAVALDLTSLVWTAAFGGVVWLLVVSSAIGHSSGWAVAVIVLGAGLIGVGVVANRFGRRSGSTGAPAAL